MRSKPLQAMATSAESTLSVQVDYVTFARHLLEAGPFKAISVVEYLKRERNLSTTWSKHSISLPQWANAGSQSSIECDDWYPSGQPIFQR